MIFSWKTSQIEKFPMFNKNNEELIEELKCEEITDSNILLAMKKVPRELFVEQQFIGKAYKNIPLPIDCGQTTSQPYVIAYMISCLKLINTENVLEIGTGTGYQTAILSHLCKYVYTVEIHSKLIGKAKKNIKKLNLKNIAFKLGNGARGWESKVLFDTIIISAASKVTPSKLLENLKNQGRLIMPKKDSLENQRLLLIKKNNENYLKEELLDVKFVPLLNKDTE